MTHTWLMCAGSMAYACVLNNEYVLYSCSTYLAIHSHSSCTVPYLQQVAESSVLLLCYKGLPHEWQCRLR